MMSEHPELDELQTAYKNAVEAWIAAIRKEEEALASVAHDIAEVDKWEQAHFEEDEMRSAVKDAKSKYEDAHARSFLGFEAPSFRALAERCSSLCPRPL
jgi:hypothetical protein